MGHDQSSLVLCFGEVLWDCLPAGLFLGGAPLNVAFHLQQLGRSPSIISALGRDQLGDEALRRIKQWGVDCRWLSRTDLPTGTVQVTLKDGQPSYTIVESVAWDGITVDDDALTAAANARALVYGSLAQRGAANRAALHTLRQACGGLQAYDVNLRAPFDDAEFIHSLAANADLIKLNEQELAVLVPSTGDYQAKARRLQDQHHCAHVCVTAGAQGAGLLSADRWHWCPAQAVTIRDTVGAGDSFMAALIDGLLSAGGADLSPEQGTALLQRACRLAEFVASQNGATPNHP